MRFLLLVGALAAQAASAQDHGDHGYTARGTTCEVRSSVDSLGNLHFRVYSLTFNGGARVDIPLGKLPLTEGAVLSSQLHADGFDRDLRVSYSGGKLHSFTRLYHYGGASVWTELAIDPYLLHPASAALTSGVDGVPKVDQACLFL